MLVGSGGWLSLLGRRWEWTDFHGLDQAMGEGEAMADVVIGEDGSGEIADDLVNFDQDAAGVFRVEGDRLDVRVDLAPLLGPVGANFFGPADKAALERFRPGDVRGHGGEGGIDVPGVEGGIGGAEQFDF